MKRMSALVLFLAASAVLVFSQTPSLAPKDARSMGMGGTFSAFSSGYSSFYGNPAGFASSSSLTFLDTSTWAYLDPSPGNLSKLQRMIEASRNDPIIRLTLEEYLASNGLGGGEAAGFGWTGGGVGLGAFVASENFASGSHLSGTKISSANSANAILGLGIPLIKSRLVNFSLGGDVRPFLRVDSTSSGWTLTDILDPILDGTALDPAMKAQTVSTGYGLAMDFGGMLSIGPLLFGVSVRDVAPTFQIADTTIGELLSLRIPEGPYRNTVFTPQITAGGGLSMKFIPNVVESNLYAEIKDPVAVVTGTKDVMLALHGGLDLHLVNFLTLRAGINSGYVSYGMGIDLVVLELDAALFTEELGSYIGEKPRTGISIQAALRF